MQLETKSYQSSGMTPHMTVREKGQAALQWASKFVRPQPEDIQVVNDQHWYIEHFKRHGSEAVLDEIGCMKKRLK